ncbi:MAG: twin-arginine translocation signal domain-containing protein [Woeseiaceae bacterium]
MSRKSRTCADDRRAFLKTLAAAGGAAAAVTITGQSASAAPAADTSSGAAKQKGYQETAHIRTYYRTARL